MRAEHPTAPDAEVTMTAPGMTADLPALFARVRSHGGSARAVFSDGRAARVFTDDADVRTILGDRRFVVDPAHVPGVEPLSRADLLRSLGISEDLTPYLIEGLLDKDGADHARLRKLVTRAFTARRTSAMRPRIQRIADDLLAALPAHAEDGSVDLVRHFADPLPITVICELLGVPEDERGDWRRWSHVLTSLDLSRMDALDATTRAVVERVRSMIERRRAAPGEDLLDTLVRARDEDGGRLSETELVTMVFTLVIAGHETTSSLIGNGAHALLTHPDQLALLRSDPDLYPAAVHEMLRWRGSVVNTRPRFATEDVALRTARVAAGERVVPLIAGANRDPLAHPDADGFDITRQHGRPGEAHVAFGHGLHYCLGATLARLEGEIAFRSLVSAYPGLSLDPGRPPRVDASANFVRFTDLRVRL